MRYFFIFIAGMFIGALLLWGISARRDRADVEQTEMAVDYPFSRKEKGWLLILRESGEEDAQDGNPAERKFCMYDENGQLLQEFSCGIVTEDVVLRFEAFFDHYYNKDMVVYPSDAQETGADGLCYQWDSGKQRFVEEPVAIPWYQEGSLRDEAFLADHGFAGAKPFYEYCDQFGNLIMELYFDPQAGRVFQADCFRR